MVHGFRPVDMSIATSAPDSPFVKYKDYGLRLDLGGGMCASPKADVINALLTRWQEVRAGH